MAEEFPELQTEDEVMFYDTDLGGVVHNLAYLRMIERNRTLLADRIGFELATLAERQVFPVVIRTEIDYRQPARLGDVIETRGWLDEWGRARFWCRFEMRRRGTAEVLVTSRQALAVVQMPEGRIIRLPKEAGGLTG